MRDRVARAGVPHVVFAIGGLQRGGSELQMLRLVELTHGTSCRATVVTLSAYVTDEARARLERLGVELVSLSPPRLPAPCARRLSPAGFSGSFVD